MMVSTSLTAIVALVVLATLVDGSPAYRQHNEHLGRDNFNVEPTAVQHRGLPRSMPRCRKVTKSRNTHSGPAATYTSYGSSTRTQTQTHSYSSGVSISSSSSSTASNSPTSRGSYDGSSSFTTTQTSDTSEYSTSTTTSAFSDTTSNISSSITNDNNSSTRTISTATASTSTQLDEDSTTSTNTLGTTTVTTSGRASEITASTSSSTTGTSFSVTVSTTTTASSTSETAVQPTPGQPFSLQISLQSTKAKRAGSSVGFMNRQAVLVNDPTQAFAFSITSGGQLVRYVDGYPVGAVELGSGQPLSWFYPTETALVTTAGWSFSNAGLAYPGARFCIQDDNVIYMISENAELAGCSPVEMQPDTNAESFNLDLGSTSTTSSNAATTTTSSPTSSATTSLNISTASDTSTASISTTSSETTTSFEASSTITTTESTSTSDISISSTTSTTALPTASESITTTESSIMTEISTTTEPSTTTGVSTTDSISMTESSITTESGTTSESTSNTSESMLETQTTTTSVSTTTETSSTIVTGTTASTTVVESSVTTGEDTTSTGSTATTTTTTTTLSVVATDNSPAPLPTGPCHDGEQYSNIYTLSNGDLYGRCQGDCRDRGDIVNGAFVMESDVDDTWCALACSQVSDCVVGQVGFFEADSGPQICNGAACRMCYLKSSLGRQENCGSTFDAYYRINSGQSGTSTTVFTSTTAADITTTSESTTTTTTTTTMTATTTVSTPDVDPASCTFVSVESAGMSYKQFYAGAGYLMYNGPFNNDPENRAIVTAYWENDFWTPCKIIQDCAATAARKSYRTFELAVAAGGEWNCLAFVGATNNPNYFMTPQPVYTQVYGYVDSTFTAEIVPITPTSCSSSGDIVKNVLGLEYQNFYDGYGAKIPRNVYDPTGLNGGGATWYDPALWSLCSAIQDCAGVAQENNYKTFEFYMDDSANGRWTCLLLPPLLQDPSLFQPDNTIREIYGFYLKSIPSATTSSVTTTVLTTSSSATSTATTGPPSSSACPDGSDFYRVVDEPTDRRFGFCQDAAFSGGSNGAEEVLVESEEDCVDECGIRPSCVATRFAEGVCHIHYSMYPLEASPGSIAIIQIEPSVPVTTLTTTTSSFAITTTTTTTTAVTNMPTGPCPGGADFLRTVDEPTDRLFGFCQDANYIDGNSDAEQVFVADDGDCVDECGIRDACVGAMFQDGACYIHYTLRQLESSPGSMAIIQVRPSVPIENPATTTTVESTTAPTTTTPTPVPTGPCPDGADFTRTVDEPNDRVFGFCQDANFIGESSDAEQIFVDDDGDCVDECGIRDSCVGAIFEDGVCYIHYSLRLLESSLGSVAIIQIQPSVPVANPTPSTTITTTTTPAASTTISTPQPNGPCPGGADFFRTADEPEDRIFGFCQDANFVDGNSDAEQVLVEDYGDCVDECGIRAMCVGTMFANGVCYIHYTLRALESSPGSVAIIQIQPSVST